MEHIDNKWFAVVNPHAGSGRTVSEWKKAETLLADRNVEYECGMTDCKFHATEMAFGAAGRGFRRFIAVGGDGTVHEVLDGIMHYISDSRLKGSVVSLSEFTLAVIPIGSGNDWIKSHNIRQDTETVVDLIADESFSVQDVVKVSILRSAEDDAPVRCSYMINVGGIGFDARICERVNACKDRGQSGRMLYVKSLLYFLMRYRNSSIEVFCDGEKVYSGVYMSVAFGLGRYSGGGMRQTPDAVLDDGLLDMTIIPAFPLLRIAREAYKLFNCRFLSIKELVVRKAKSIKVVPASDVSELVEVDGEVIGCVPVQFDVLEDRINVLHN